MSHPSDLIAIAITDEIISRLVLTTSHKSKEIKARMA
jgi:hypothetical protein